MYYCFGTTTNRFIITVYQTQTLSVGTISWDPTGCRGKREEISVTKNERISLSVGRVGARSNDALGRVERKSRKVIKKRKSLLAAQTKR